MQNDVSGRGTRSECVSSLWVSVSRWYLNSQQLHTHAHARSRTHTCLHAPRARPGQVSPVCGSTDTHEHTQIVLNKCPLSGGRFLWKLIQVGRMRSWTSAPLFTPRPLKSTSVVPATWTNKQLHLSTKAEREAVESVCVCVKVLYFYSALLAPCRKIFIFSNSSFQDTQTQAWLCEGDYLLW